jgi:hypothetical protein
LVRGEILVGEILRCAQNDAKGTGVTNVTSIDASASTDDRDLLIQRAGRPRDIRAKPVAMGLQLLGTAVAAVIAYAIASTLFDKWTTLKASGDFWAAGWPGMLGLLLFVALVAANVFSVFRDRDLCRNGEVAIAAVTSKKIHSRSGSWITYCFKDVHGVEYRGACTDRTGQLLPGMTFAVFYEAELPRNRIASCESNFKIVLSGE